MKYVYSVLILLLALFLAAFIQQNSASIQLKYFYWSTPHLPLSLYMILCFALGYALAVVVGFASGIRFRLRATGAEREIRQLRSELDTLKKEELKAVSSEFKPDPQEPSPADDEKTATRDRATESIPQDDADPTAQTVIIGSGGEEEK